MMVQAPVNKLESWVQQELSAQRTLLELLDEQQEAITAGSGAGITAAGEKIQAHLRTAPARERRRLEITRDLGRAWGVAGETLTLRSIVERAAEDGVAVDTLRRAREELREVGARVLQAGRRIAVMAKFHQGLLAEMLGIILGDCGAEHTSFDGPPAEGGILVNQEA